MVARREYGGLLFVLAACVASVYLLTSSPARPVSLFSQADLNIIDSAENQDSTPQELALKNDDGHTRMWNAEAPAQSGPIKAAVASDDADVNYGMPKFFAHATGWVDDIGSPRATSRRSSGLLASGGTTSLLSDQSVQDINKWETAMLRSSYPDADANPAAAAAARSQGARLAAGLKKMAVMAKTQKLWNAASNDEIRVDTIGHLHPSEMSELQRMSPEYHQASTHAHVTSATHMAYHPLKWMHEQRDPHAVAPRAAHTSKLSQTVSHKSARMQQLWNAGADDTVGGDPSIDEGHGQVEYHPRKWIATQSDPSEQASLAAPRAYTGRVFQEKSNHNRNYEGSYVNDNSIGIKVDALKGRATMLAQLPTTGLVQDEEVVKVLEGLHSKAMDAVGYLPDETPPVVLHLAEEDAEKVIAIFDDLRRRALIGESGGDDSSVNTTALLSVHKLGLAQVVNALNDGVGKPLDAMHQALRQLESNRKPGQDVNGQKQAIIVKALSDARDSTVQILAEPAYAHFKASEEQSISHLLSSHKNAIKTHSASVTRKVIGGKPKHIA